MSLSALLFVALYLFGTLRSVVGLTAWGFITYQVVYFANPGIRWWAAPLPDLPYSKIAVVCMAISVILRFRELSFRIRDIPPIFWLLIILSIHVLIIPVVVAPDTHSKVLNEYINLCIIMVLAFMLLNSMGLLRMSIWTYACGAAYIGLVAFSVGRNSGSRVEGIGMVDSPDSNDFAAAIAPALAVLLVKLATGSVWQRVVAAVLGALIANGLILINSRGAFVAVVVGCGYVAFRLYYSKFQAAKQRLSVILAIVIGLGGALALADDAFWSRMSTLQEVDDGRASGSHRVGMWVSAVELASDYPLGAGARGFNVLSPIYVDPSLFFGGQKTKAVHSSWFQALAETGWLGLFSFLMLCYSAHRVNRRTMKQCLERNDVSSYWTIVSIQGGLISFLVAASFIDRFRAEILYWMVLFSACAYHVLVVNQRTADVEAQLPELPKKTGLQQPRITKDNKVSTKMNKL